VNENNYAVNNLAEQIKNLSQGLYYMSETDAEILPFIGTAAKSVTKEEILRQTKGLPGTPVEERDFAGIFDRLISIQDWYGEEETAAAGNFAALRELLEKNLKDLKVFKIGKIELDIYFVGLDASGNLMGIKTKAVET
jgi:hypothetical protein